MNSLSKHVLFAALLPLFLSFTPTEAVRLSAPDNDEEASNKTQETIDFEKINTPTTFGTRTFYTWFVHSHINQDFLSIKYLAEYHEKTYHLVITLERVNQNKNLIVNLSGFVYQYPQPLDQTQDFLALNFAAPIEHYPTIVETCLVIFLTNIIALCSDNDIKAKNHERITSHLVIPKEKIFGKKNYHLKRSHTERNHNTIRIFYELHENQIAYELEIMAQFQPDTHSLILELKTLKVTTPDHPGECVMQTKLLVPINEQKTAIDLGLSVFIADFLLQMNTPKASSDAGQGACA